MAGHEIQGANLPTPLPACPIQRRLQGNGAAHDLGLTWYCSCFEAVITAHRSSGLVESADRCSTLSEGLCGLYAAHDRQQENLSDLYSSASDFDQEH